MNCKKIMSLILVTAMASTTLFQIKADATDMPPEIPQGGMPGNGIPPELPPDGQMPPDGMNSAGFNPDRGSSVETTGKYIVNNTTETKNGDNLTASDSNESAIKVTNEGKLTLSDSKLNKTAGEMTVEEASDFFGANAGFLANEGSTAFLENVEINTSVSGGNAVFSTGEGTKVTLKDVTINTTGDHSRGLDATYNGAIDADNITVNTKGAHCAAVATDRGEGTINVKNSELNTSGEGSPCVYSTGDINVSDTKGFSKGSSIAVIEGKNSIELDNCDFIAYAIGRGQGGVDDTGVMVYQSMSGDASSGVGSFSVKDSKLSISEDSPKYEKSPMFFVTNTDAVINIENTDLSFGSGILLNVAGNDGEWGRNGSNGGNLDFTAVNQKLEGKITVDNISKADLALKEGTVLTSEINSSNSAKEINLSLDKDSTWNVAGTSHITSLVDEDSDLSNIKDNGNTIYYDVNNSANSWLEGKTIELSDGGKLVPETRSVETDTTVDDKEDSKGIKQSGWKSENGSWYYLNSKGQKLKGWQKDNGKWYLLNNDGVMLTGWQKDTDGNWYYLNNNGEMQTGWMKDKSGRWYYLKDNGAMAASETIDGYYLGSDGAMQ